jgi:hypothetical protein
MMHRTTFFSSSIVLALIATGCAASSAPESSTFGESNGSARGSTDPGAGGSVAGSGQDQAANDAAACSAATSVQGGAVAVSAHQATPFACYLSGATVTAVGQDVTGTSWIVGRAAPVIDFGHGKMHLDVPSSAFVARYDADCNETFHAFYTDTTVEGLSVPWSGSPYLTLADQKSATLVALGDDGIERWRKSYEVTMRSLSSNAAGDVVMSGVYVKAPDFGVGAMPDASQGTGGWIDFVLVIDSAGNTKWVKTQIDGTHGAGSDACVNGSCPSGIAAIADDGTVVVDNGLFATDVARGASQLAVLPAGRALGTIPNGSFVSGVSRIAFDNSGSALLFGELASYQSKTGDAVVKVPLFSGASPLACMMH